MSKTAHKYPRFTSTLPFHAGKELCTGVEGLLSSSKYLDESKSLAEELKDDMDSG